MPRRVATRRGNKLWSRYDFDHLSINRELRVKLIRSADSTRLRIEATIASIVYGVDLWIRMNRAFPPRSLTAFLQGKREFLCQILRTINTSLCLFEDVCD